MTSEQQGSRCTRVPRGQRCPNTPAADVGRWERGLHQPWFSFCLQVQEKTETGRRCYHWDVAGGGRGWGRGWGLRGGWWVPCREAEQCRREALPASNSFSPLVSMAKPGLLRPSHPLRFFKALQGCQSPFPVLETSLKLCKCWCGTRERRTGVTPQLSTALTRSWCSTEALCRLGGAGGVLLPLVPLPSA